MEEDGVTEWTRQINAHGFSFVKGCPVDGPATKQLLEKIGPIRETHYGTICQSDHVLQNQLIDHRWLL